MSSKQWIFWVHKMQQCKTKKLWKDDNFTANSPVKPLYIPTVKYFPSSNINFMPVEHTGDFFKKKEILDKREIHNIWTPVSLVTKKDNFELNNHL